VNNKRKKLKKMDYNAFLQKHYDKIWDDSKDAILKNKISLDPSLYNLSKDVRQGLTLITPLNHKVSGKIAKIMKLLKNIEPEQYYYPFENMHITTLNLTPFTKDFVFDKKQCEAFNKVFKKAFIGIKPFNVKLKGITSSKGAVIIQGFYKDAFQKIREDIRREAQKQGVSLNEDYERKTAHSTIIRFRKKLRSPKDFVNQIEKHRNTDLGTVRIDKVLLVLTDWYNRKEKKTIIATYQLG
jgi:2'-5' RNA ligase